MGEDEDNARSARIREAQEADAKSWLAAVEHDARAAGAKWGDAPLKPVAELTLGELEAEMRERGLVDLSLWLEPGGLWHAQSLDAPRGGQEVGVAFEVSSETMAGAIGGALRGRA